MNNKCEICGEPTNERLCNVCDNARLTAASLDRIMNGSGLTYSNAEAFTVDNWIKAIKKDDPFK